VPSSRLWIIWELYENVEKAMAKTREQELGKRRQMKKKIAYFYSAQRKPARGPGFFSSLL